MGRGYNAAKSLISRDIVLLKNEKDCTLHKWGFWTGEWRLNHLLSYCVSMDVFILVFLELCLIYLKKYCFRNLYLLFSTKFTNMSHIKKERLILSTKKQLKPGFATTTFLPHFQEGSREKNNQFVVHSQTKTRSPKNVVMDLKNTNLMFEKDFLVRNGEFRPVYIVMYIQRKFCKIFMKLLNSE